MNRFLIVPIALFAMTLTAHADDIDDITIKIDGQTYWALYRFYDTKKSEHVYTYGRGEPVRLRKLQHMKGEKIIGYISIKQMPGTKRLYTAVRPDGLHYYYLRAPKGKTYSIEDSRIWVWTNKKKGQIPIHACFFPDGTSTLFDSDINLIKNSIKGAKLSTGRKRLLKRSVFYIYEKPKTESDKKQNEMKDRNQNKK